MNRYWPLTIALLAFWLGRETGAQGREAKKDEMFDTIKVGKTVADRIELGDEEDRFVVVSAKGVTVRDANKQRTARLRPSAVNLYAKDKAVAVLCVHDEGKGGALIVAPERPGPMATVTAGEFSIRDEQYRSRMVLVHRNGATQLTMTEADGTLRVGLFHEPKAAGVGCYKRDGKAGAVLTPQGVEK